MVFDAARANQQAVILITLRVYTSFSARHTVLQYRGRWRGVGAGTV